MIKSTKYLITFALLTTVDVAFCCLPISAAITESMGIPISISVTAKMQNSTNTAVRTAFFAQKSKNKEPLLRMVIIRATSSIEVRQLRGMHLDIVRVKPDSDCPPGGELLSGGFIVEAVVTSGQLAKLKKMGFKVSEVPEKN